MDINTTIPEINNLGARRSILWSVWSLVGAKCGPGNSTLKNHLEVGWGGGAFVKNAASQALPSTTEFESLCLEVGIFTRASQ